MNAKHEEEAGMNGFYSLKQTEGMIKVRPQGEEAQRIL